MVAYLKKTYGSEGFHQIVDFLNSSHIRYALTENPAIYVSLIQQFWQTTTASILDNGEMEITTTIDGKVKTIFEASIRRHLKLEDSDGISNLPTTEIFEQLALMGTYIAPTLTQKLFSNMRRASKGYTGVDISLFPTMLVQGPVVQCEGSTVLVESHHTPTSTPSTSQPPISSPSRRTIKQESEVPQSSSPPHTNVADVAASTGVVVRHGGAATTVTSLDAGQGSEDLEDPSKQGRKIDEIDQDPDISLVQHDAKVQGRHEHDMESDFEFTAAKEVYTADLGISTAKPVSTAGAAVTTASVTISTASPTRVSTTDDISIAETLMYIRRSASKDKGKAKMDESESVQTKTKLQQRQERLSYKASLRLQEQLDEEER
ncbi:hypothetical protein Tco_0673771 [Tanacetum coccineum]